MIGFDVLAAMVEAIWPVVKGLAELGLVLFAGTQLWLHARERRDRQRTAFGVLYAEYWRLNARALDWEDENLVATAQTGGLHHEDLAPRDWGVVMRSLGELGPESAALGAFAYALLNQVVRAARILADTHGSGTVAADGPALQAHCTKTLAEVVTTLDDAMRAAPRAVRVVTFTLPDAKSQAGQQLTQSYAEMLQQRAAPSGFWATRTGRILSSVGRALRP